MRSIRFEATSRCGASGAIGDRIEDVGIACALVRGAVASAEAAIASSGYRSRSWSPADFVLAQELRRVDAAAGAFERAIAPPVHLPSPATLATIARVEKVRASMPSADAQQTIATISAAHAAMPDARVRATIATVEAAHHAVSRQLKG